MINKFVINGILGNRYSYTAIYCGHDISRETYFFDSNPKGERSLIRFFSKGSELVLTRDGIDHYGNGGYFCEYMFADASSISDMINTDVLNRLILYGARHDEARRTLTFTGPTDGSIAYDTLFDTSNAISNWFFFVSSKVNTDIFQRQKWLLKNAGRFLKTTPLISIRESNSYNRLADELIKKLPDEELHLFILRLTDMNSHKYAKLVSENLKFDPLFKSDKWIQRNSSVNLPNERKERIKLDTIYKYENNKKIIDTYKMLLVEAQKRPNLPQSAQNYIYRYKSLITRKNIPSQICDFIEKKFPTRIKAEESDDYIGEFKLVFSNLLFTEHSYREDLVKDDLKILLFSKHRAFIENNKSFEQILIDLGKKLDEINDEALKIKQMDFFSRVVTYFDHYDSCSAILTKIALGADTAIDRTKVRGLLKYYETFNSIEEKFFEKLFIEPIVKRKLLSNYGLKKLSTLTLGFEEILCGSKTDEEVAQDLKHLINEEEYYREATQAIREIASWKTMEYSSENEIAALKQKVATRRSLSGLSDKIFRKALQDYNLEAIYFSETIPEMILTSNWDHRREFMKTSGLDPLRIEEVEEIYCRRNNLSKNYLSSISGTK